MVSDSEIYEAMQEVQRGHIVRWNGRSNPQVVTEVTDSGFVVKSHQGSYYRFYRDGQYLVNQQSDTEYDVYQFGIVGKAYDVDDW